MYVFQEILTSVKSYKQVKLSHAKRQLLKELKNRFKPIPLHETKSP